VYGHREDQAERIYAQVTFAAECLLARVVAVTAFFRGAQVFTDCESIAAAVGVGFWPALRLTFSRNLPWMRCQVPSRRQLR